MPSDHSSADPIERSSSREVTGPPSPAAARHRAARLARLRGWVIGVGAAVILANAGAAHYDAWQSYQQSIANTGRELVNTARILAAQTAAMLQALDVLLRDVADWYSREGAGAPAGVDAELATRAQGLPWLLRLSITDANGIEQFHSRAPAPAGTDISERSYFIAHRDNPALGLFVSEPMLLQAEGHAAIALSRRLTDRNGNFAGVVAGYIPLHHAQDLYRQIDLGANSSILLLREDGTLLAREPVIPDAAGKSFPALAALGRESAGAVTMPSPIDGVRRFTGGAPVEGFPLLVDVARDEESVLGPLRVEALRVAGRELLLSLLGALAIAALVRQLRRVELGEQALRESEERYALAMEAANEGHFDASLSNGPSFFSEKMVELFTGKAAKAMTSLEEFRSQVEVHPDDLPALDAAMDGQLEDGTQRFEIEHRVMRGSEWHWVHIRGRRMHDAEGRVRLVGSAADVTERKRAEAEKERLETRLRKAQKMEAIGTLAGGIAHDFNNILGAILGYGEMAQKAAADGSDIRRYVDNVMHAGARAKALVERILAFSRSGMGERAPVDVQAVVEETLELLAASLPAAVPLERKLEAGGLVVMGDATQLHQVVMNLCTNAVQAMPQGGVLETRLERADVPEPQSLSHGELLPGAYLRLTVGDTGSGIAPDVLDRMFDPFFTTKGVGEGTGLGLSLVHGIVADMGGAIHVESAPERGTTIAVWLPAPAAAPLLATKAGAELPRGNGEVVMVVDDEPALVALAEEMLAELGYEPVGFRSSTAALEAFAADPQRFDLVLADEMMPELTGTGLALTIKRRRSDIPIVIMTGYSDSGVAALARSAGISEILRKPLQRRDIADSLARVLRGAPETALAGR